MSFDDFKNLLAEDAEPVLSPTEIDKNMVMIIDDDEHVREDLALTLGKDYNVKLCATGKEAIAMIDSNIQVVILDIKMPDQDGFTTFKQIKKRFRHIPIIFHSAYQDLKDPYEVINEYRPFGYVSKDSDLSVLINSVANAIDFEAQIVKNEQLVKRMEVIFEGTREITRFFDEFTIMASAVNTILKEIPVTPEAIIHLIFKERGHEKSEGYAHFRMPVELTDLGKYALKMDSIRSTTHFFTYDAPGSHSDQALLSSEECIPEKDELRIPLFYKKKLLGIIEIYGIDQHHFRQEHQDFVNVLSPSLSIALAHIHRHRKTEATLYEHARMESELQTAAAVQKALFPDPLPSFGNLELASFYQSADETGGDWYGFITPNDHQFFILIGDVTGHGTPAALVTATANATCSMMEKMYHSGYEQPSPSGILKYLNQTVFEAGSPDYLMTFFAALIDANTGCLSFSNAGHNFPILMREDGTHHFLLNINFRLGDRQNTQFTEDSIQLLAGDTLFFMTDGLIENFNRKGRMWGQRNLVKCLKKYRRDPVQHLVNQVVKEAKLFREGLSIDDDIAVVGCRVTSPFSKHEAVGKSKN